MDGIISGNQSKYRWPISSLVTPFVFVAAFLLIFGFFLFTIYNNSKIEQTKDIHILAERIAKSIELKLKGNLDYLKIIALERADGNITEQSFQDHVIHYLKDHPEFINITWVDSNYVIKTVCPLEGNSHIIGLHLELPEPKRVSHLAREKKESVYTKAFEAIQANSSFEVWVPVFKDEKFLGLMAGVYSCSNLLKQSIPVNNKYKTNYCLIDEKNETLADISDLNLTGKRISHQAPLAFLQNGLMVRIEFQESKPFSLVMSLLALICIVLFLGFSFSLLKIKREMQMRHEFQESLKTSEETYRMLFDSINDAVFISEPSDDRKSVKFIKVNEIACQRLGYTEKELLAKSPFEINTVKSQPNISGFISKILENKQALIETEHVTKDGRIIPVEISTRVTQFKNRIIFHSIARDITERKQNELRIKEKTDEIEVQNEEYQQINKELNQVNQELFAAKDKAEASEANLKKSNEELKQTIQRLTDLENRLQFALIAGKLGTWDWDIQTGKIIWSDLSKIMSGIPLDADIDYNYFQSTMLAEDREKINDLVLTALREKKDYLSEYRVKWPDGSIHWLRVMGRGIYDDHEQPLSMIGVGMEITESKHAELVMEHSHKLMSYIIQHNPSSIAVFDKNLRYIYVSESYLKDFKVKELDIIGKYHYDIFTDLPQKYKDAHQKSMLGEITGADEDPYYREDGSVNWTHWECRPWHEADGTIGGIILYTEQITDRIKQKLELIAAKEKAEESDRLKTSFLQNMSHEIRTPMNAIIGFSELLVDQFSNKDKLERYTQIIRQRSKDLLNIINDILDISKLESGLLSCNLEEFNLDELFGELNTFYNEYQSRLNKTNLMFSIQPQFTTIRRAIKTDKFKLKQIFINLITNAFKFTDEGKIEIGVISDNNNFIKFFVLDTGIGIPKDKHLIIFERFIQLNQSNQKNIGGTGLGLSIVKGLVHFLGGEIILESEPGKGSKFIFTIQHR